MSSSPKRHRGIETRLRGTLANGGGLVRRPQAPLHSGVDHQPDLAQLLIMASPTRAMNHPGLLLRLLLLLFTFAGASGVPWISEQPFLVKETVSKFSVGGAKFEP